MADALCCPRLQSGFLNSFPFDPLGQYSPRQAESEIKNGRLGGWLCFREKQDPDSVLCSSWPRHSTPCLCGSLASELRACLRLIHLTSRVHFAAMLAFVGFASVYANRGMTPLQALKAHIADPGQQNSASLQLPESRRQHNSALCLASCK